MKTIVEPARAGGMFAGSAVCAIASAVAAVGIATDPGLSALSQLSAGVVGGLFALSFGATAVALGRPHGGMLLDETAREVIFGITGPRDVWRVPVTRIIAVRLAPHLVPLGEVMDREWSVTLLLRDSPDLVLADAPEREIVEDIALAVAEALSVTLQEDPDPVQGPAPAGARLEERVVVRGAAALHPVLASFGAALTATGAGLMTQLYVLPGMALFFGPVLALLGIALLAVVGVRQLGREELRYENATWSHETWLGGWRLSRAEVDAAGTTWRLRLQATKGARMELVGGRRTLMLGASATMRSRMSVTDLVELMRWAGQSPRPSAAPSPPPSA